MTAGRPSRSPKSRWSQPLGLVLRLAVMGIGLGVITGTSLKLLAPRLAQGAIKPPSLDGAAVGTGQGLDQGRFEPRTELPALSRRWSELAAAKKDLTASAFLLVLDDGRFAQLQPDLPLDRKSVV